MNGRKHETRFIACKDQLVSMFHNIVLPLHVGPSARLATAPLHEGADVFLDTVRPLALSSSLVVALVEIEVLAYGQVPVLQIRPEMISVRFMHLTAHHDHS